ncbi:S-adenosyl-L-methionine-dependent methyltransferase-19 [Coleophoma crateriformis]|uniref:S-adenosyl-L-methionine-dependent methyltransferase-19 n=1 Tax=Coleophoma crateriformis TaxID=565419 RepID=A0A3D8Q3R3_9HELO|nr:S-adenosyl-L-methionine-dependent methyltransferase-19 [Coleophoma crateriformis]
MAAVQNVVIEAEADDYENDSGIEGSIATSTSSITSSIMKYRVENGRTYHAYKDGAYAFPNDEIENDRLDLQHHQLTLTFGGKLFTAPIPKEKQLHNVLDVGTGTGIWAIDFADEHPETKVIGVDLSPIQPSYVPPNLVFQIDDLESNWTFSEKFDFIFSRMMIGSFADVPRFIQQSFDNLTPGGYLEMVDLSFPVKLNDGEFPPDSAFLKWYFYFVWDAMSAPANDKRSTLFMEASAKAGRLANCAQFYKQQLLDAGFVDVVETKYIWPQNRWPKDKKLKEIGLYSVIQNLASLAKVSIGLWQLENLSGGLEAISVGLFTRVLGWSKPELDVFLAQVRNELKDTKIHAYFDM